LWLPSGGEDAWMGEALKVEVADGEGGASGLEAAAVGVQGGAASGSAASSGYTA
jgi:hypothetical protein